LRFAEPLWRSSVTAPDQPRRLPMSLTRKIDLIALFVAFGFVTAVVAGVF
jgi:hypothetical protein